MVRFYTVTVQRYGSEAPATSQLMKHFGHLGATPLGAGEPGGNLFLQIKWFRNEEMFELALEDIYRSYDGLGFTLARRLDDTGDRILAYLYRYHAGTLHKAEQLRVHRRRSPPGWDATPIEEFDDEPIYRHKRGYEGRFLSYLQHTYGLETDAAWDIGLGTTNPDSIVPTVSDTAVDQVGYYVRFTYDDFVDADRSEQEHFADLLSQVDSTLVSVEDVTCSRQGTTAFVNATQVLSPRRTIGLVHQLAKSRYEHPRTPVSRRGWDYGFINKGNIDDRIDKFHRSGVDPDHEQLRCALAVDIPYRVPGYHTVETFQQLCNSRTTVDEGYTANDRIFASIELSERDSPWAIGRLLAIASHRSMDWGDADVPWPSPSDPDVRCSVDVSIEDMK